MQALGRETWQPNIPVKGYCAPLMHLQKIETCPEMSGGRWKQAAPGCLEVDVVLPKCRGWSGRVSLLLLSSRVE